MDLPDEVDTPRATDGPGALGQTDEVEHERAAAEADARHERMDRVAVLYGEITAATREFLRAIAECDRHRDWAQEGFASCADWLAWRIGVTRNVAGEKIRAARALESLPLISDAMAGGQISFSKVRALTRAATPDNEAELLEYARAASAASLERLVRGWKTLGRVDEARAERLRHRMRSFSVFPNNEGMFVVKGVVTPEVGALLQRAIEAAGDALFSASAADDGQRQEPDQLRADALALVAERALAAGFGRGHAAEEAPISGSRAERYQVILHVEPEPLTEHGEPGMCELEDGSRLSAESARRLACDAGLVAVARGDEGGAAAGECAHCRALDLGRKTRTVPPSVRRALGARDGGCRFPGCRLRFTDAHHIVHWADGGETELHNLILLCARHHRAVHEGGFRVCTDKDAVAVFFSPSGRVIAEAPPMPGLEADPLERLVARNRAHGSAPDWRSGRQEWRRDEDVPWDRGRGARGDGSSVRRGHDEWLGARGCGPSRRPRWRGCLTGRPGTRDPRARVAGSAAGLSHPRGPPAPPARGGCSAPRGRARAFGPRRPRGSPAPSQRRSAAPEEQLAEVVHLNELPRTLLHGGAHMTLGALPRRLGVPDRRLTPSSAVGPSAAAAAADAGRCAPRIHSLQFAHRLAQRSPGGGAMRLSCALFALVALSAPAGATAQDRFGSVPVEPRPEEYLHWDSEAFDEIRRDLEGRIEEGSRIWNTRFVFTSVLPQAEHRPHDISIVHREGYTQPEIHELKWDLYMILDGSGTVLVGGARVAWVDGRPGEEQRPELRGAQAFQVAKGDLVHVPARVWHQVVLEPGASMTYVLINVNEPG